MLYDQNYSFYSYAVVTVGVGQLLDKPTLSNLISKVTRANVMPSPVVVFNTQY